MKKLYRLFFSIIFSFLVVFNPISTNKNAVKAVSIGVLGDATPYASYENGILSVGIEGGEFLGLNAGDRLYPSVQYPQEEAFTAIFQHPNIRDYIKMEYTTPGLLGIISNDGEVTGDDLTLYTSENGNVNIAAGEVDTGINLSLLGLGNYGFTFKIDIAGLDISIPTDNYSFNITVGEDSLIDVDLLNASESHTELTFGYVSSTEPEVSTSTAVTEVSTNFLPSVNEPPPILDPSNPSTEYEPPNEPTGETGELTLDYVSSFNFGEGEVLVETQTFETTNLTPFIQVTNRQNDDSGWVVTAELSEFHSMDANSSESTLLGTKLNLLNGLPVSPVNGEAPIASQNVELYAGGEAVAVVETYPGAGTGTWLNRWFPTEEVSNRNNSVTLEIPGGQASPGQHQATITWTLSDVPNEQLSVE